MTAPTAPSGRAPSLRSGTRLLRARWQWVVATTVIVVLVAAVVSFLQPRSYRSSVEVVVLPVVTANGPAPQTPQMNTEKSLITFGVIAAPVAQQLGVPIEQLVDSVTVTVPPQTTTMQITCARPQAQAAADCAQALGETYVEYKDTQPIATLPERARILSAAAVPASPSVPNWWLNLVAGLLVGLVLGVLVALVRDRTDRRCRRPEDLERRGLRVLGVVPPTGRSVAADSARDHGALAARLRVAAGGPGSPGPVVVVSAVGPNGGSARGIAGALASALASAGDRVVLVNADTVGGDEGPAGRPGLLDLLAGDADLDGATTRTAHPYLTHLALGRRPGARIALRDWSPLAAELADRYDVVVVSADPVLASANGLALAQGASALLAVVDAGGTTREAVDALVDEGEQLALPLVGAVLVRGGRRARPASSGDWARWADDDATPPREGAGSTDGADGAQDTARDTATTGTATPDGGTQDDATTAVLRVGAPPTANGSGNRPVPPA